MDQLQRTRKMRIIAILVLYLEMLNDFITVLMSVCAYIIIDYLRHRNNKTSASSARGKRKRTTENDVVIAKLSKTIQAPRKVYESTKDNIGDLVECFKHEKEGAERRMQVFEELKKVEQLTDMERVKAGYIITKDQSAIDFFFTIDPELKALYVQQILATNIY